MSEEKTKYCPYCGVQIAYKYTVCPNCGKPQPQIDGVASIRVTTKKNPMLAVILSLLITGAGQIYLGKISRGLSFLGLVILVSILLDGILTFDELLIIGVILSVISAWDAYRLAKEINQS
jgi:TM2 domain-containing membrane protein YozV